MAYDPDRDHTRAIPEPLSKKWQAQYYERSLELWVDLGDSVDTEQEARTKIDTWTASSHMTSTRPTGRTE